MKLSNLLEVLLILIIVSFAASKPIDKENGRAVHRNHIKKGLIARQEPVDGAPVKPVAPAEDDDDDFDITDIFDVFDDDDDDEEEDSIEEESAEEAEDDDDEAEFDDDSSEEEEEADEEVETPAEGAEPDAFDLIAELLEDDEATPKPKPSTAAPEVAQALDVTPNDAEIADAVDDEEIEEEVEEALQPVITIQKVPEKKPTPKPTKAAKKPKTTTTVAPEKAELPPLNLQNTSALLELQAQLTANNVKGGDLADDDKVVTPKPTKTQKKKKTTQKVQVKKQAAITTNEISETPAEKTLMEVKPQVIVEDSVLMEKVPLKTPESEKLKQQQEQEYVDDKSDEEGVQVVSS